MNDELITRLRGRARNFRSARETHVADDFAAAADALEAAQADDEQLREGLFIVTAERDAAQAELDAAIRHATAAVEAVADERDAEAALADQLAEALFVMHQGFAPLVVSGVDTGAASDAYRAHRERRTTPTKENTDG